MTNRIRQISQLGQAIWLDFISRALLRSGRLAEYVAEGVLGVTSNPTIFQKSISSSGDYDADIARLAHQHRSAYDIYEALAIDDIRAACDVLRPVYNETHGRDGYVSLEVNPALAHDTDGTIHDARRLFADVHRPNVMIKVPGTDAGIPAITALIGEGINVNVTLIFGLEMYAKVMRAYVEGLHHFERGGLPLASVSSVASFFVSRVDSLIDRQIQERIDAGEDELDELLGKAAIANARLAYQQYKALFEGPAFADLRARGARVQRPLWASTSTKNPAYGDCMYVNALIGVNTVDTVPPATLDAIRDHGVVAQTIDRDLDQAHDVMRRLAAAGVDMRAVTDELLRDGIDQFARSFEQLIREVDVKRARFAQAA